ncbi:hypothetical protein [Halomicrobium katesii]|uniref:hypothetical protein n=1 Tax=Halomicrobium katesii TaxID=437163 RepID=UPI0012BB171B|nr:hypothetical protein [Halomicrobium katesii]
MDEANTVDDAVPVEWRQVPPDGVSPPVVQERPYLELKLEHPGLEPTETGDRFFPDAVPYELDGTSRVFYWRPALASSTAEPRDRELACGTTHELVGFESLPAEGPPLVTEGASGTTVVVDGTIGGDVTTSHVGAYVPPAVSIERHVESAVELRVDGTRHDLSPGQRRRIRLGEQRVEPVGTDGRPKTIAPELVVRFPGWRESTTPHRERRTDCSRLSVWTSKRSRIRSRSPRRPANSTIWRSRRHSASTYHGDRTPNAPSGRRLPTPRSIHTPTRRPS